jgi:hypothetical protein
MNVSVAGYSVCVTTVAVRNTVCAVAAVAACVGVLPEHLRA